MSEELDRSLARVVSLATKTQEQNTSGQSADYLQRILGNLVVEAEDAIAAVSLDSRRQVELDQAMTRRVDDVLTRVAAGQA